jgi:hypothetical protein
MIGFGMLGVFFAVGIMLVIVTPLFALLGYVIYRRKHRSGKRGALLGAITPLLGGIIGIVPSLLDRYFTVSFDIKIGIGINVPFTSIIIGIIVLIVMQTTVKPQADTTDAFSAFKAKRHARH